MAGSARVEPHGHAMSLLPAGLRPPLASALAASVVLHAGLWLAAPAGFATRPTAPRLLELEMWLEPAPLERAPPDDVTLVDGESDAPTPGAGASHAGDGETPGGAAPLARAARPAPSARPAEEPRAEPPSASAAPASDDPTARVASDDEPAPTLPSPASPALTAAAEAVAQPTASVAAPSPVTPSPVPQATEPLVPAHAEPAPRGETARGAPAVSDARGTGAAAGTSGAAGTGAGGSGPARAGGVGGATSGGGNALGAERARRAYLEALVDRIRRHRRYPYLARRRGIEGTVCMRLGIDALGRVTSLRVTCGSAHAALVEAAESAVAEASPFAPLPALLGTSLAVEVPIVFRLEEG